MCARCLIHRESKLQQYKLNILGVRSVNVSGRGLSRHGFRKKNKSIISNMFEISVREENNSTILY